MEDQAKEEGQFRDVDEGFLHKLDSVFGIISEQAGRLRPAAIVTRSRESERPRNPAFAPPEVQDQAREAGAWYPPIGGHTIEADHVIEQPYGLLIGIDPIQWNLSNPRFANSFGNSGHPDFWVVQPNPAYLKYIAERQKDITPEDDWEDEFREGIPSRNMQFRRFKTILTIRGENVESLTWK